MFKQIGQWALREMGEAALTYAGRRGTAVLTRRQLSRQVFTLTPPATIFIYGTRCQVKVHHEVGDQVTLESDLSGALQPSLTVEQDSDGIYIIAKPKPIATGLTQITLTLTMSPAIRLVAQLTPGDLIMNGLNGTVEIPPLR